MLAAVPSTSILTTVLIYGSHQPRAAIWSLFDMVLVLGKGYELFYGPPKEAEKWFTTGLGLNCPPETSIPDFIMDQANTDFDKSAY